ncbi:MAG: T9SS type A sorting domain-containing protein, partial [Flavobacteriales bacterium]
EDFTCSYPGCNQPNACNYDPTAGCDIDSICVFPQQYFNCDGSCESDVDADGICDPFETTGCTDPNACNYNPYVNNDDGSCAEQYFATENISVTSDSFPNGFEWNGALLVSSGEYVWVGVAASGCDSIVTLNFTYTIVIGIENMTSDFSVIIWPNPAKDVLNIRISNGFIADKIELIDAQGKYISQVTKSNQLNLSNIESGVYFARIYSGNQLINKRVEVIR